MNNIWQASEFKVEMDKSLLRKYFSGQCNASEAEEVLEWFQTSEGQQFLEHEIDRDIQFFDEFGEYLDYPDLDSDELFDQIKEDQSPTYGLKEFDRPNSKTSWKAAAAVLLIVGILSLFIGIFVVNWDSEKIVKTEIGEKKTILLPDSSKIVLRSNSRLKYLSEFEERKVILEGEAYFEVEHDLQKPFVVYVDKSYVKVLGTKFVISGYSGAGRVEVAVKSGRVELGSRESGSKNNSVKQLEAPDFDSEENKPIEITDDEVGVQNKNSRPFITDSTYSDELFDWVEGMMIFRDTPLKHVLSELENRYGVQCILEEPELAREKFTSSFDDETLPEVLKVLTLSLDIKYKRIGNRIYFSN